jgi:hypothetical protein
VDTCPSASRSLVALCAVATAIALAGCGRLDKDAVSTKIGEAVSAAEEGALLSHLAASGSTSGSFVAIHSAELHKVAGNAAEALSGSVEAPYRSTSYRAVRLARDVEAQLSELHASPDDPAAAARIEDHLGNLADHLGHLESRL